MSQLELFYKAVAEKLGVQRKWEDLNPMEIQVLMQGCNMILSVVHD